MLDYNQPKVRKQIASILMNIAKKIEEDGEFAKIIFSQLEENKSEGKNNAKKLSKSNQLETKINIFEIHQNQGSEGLLGFLESLDLQGLKKLVAENGLDPAQKVRRWRKKEKVINHVIESVSKQMSKGEAFLK
jgi:hypothetical protein